MAVDRPSFWGDPTSSDSAQAPIPPVVTQGLMLAATGRSVC